MLQLRIPSAFPSSGEGGEEYAPCLHHVGSRACVAARPGKKTPQLTPSLVTGIGWGCLRSLTAMRAVSSFPARTAVARHDRFCLQVLAWLVRPCGVRSCPSCLQVLWSTPPPGSQARVKPKAQAGRRSRLNLSKERLRTQELESCAPVADTFGLSFLGEGQGEEYAPCLAIT